MQYTSTVDQEDVCQSSCHTRTPHWRFCVLCSICLFVSCAWSSLLRCPCTVFYRRVVNSAWAEFRLTRDIGLVAKLLIANWNLYMLCPIDLLTLIQAQTIDKVEFSFEGRWLIYVRNGRVLSPHPTLFALCAHLMVQYCYCVFCCILSTTVFLMS